MATPNNTTVNHAYQLWADGQTDWEHRTDFEALDTDVEIRDTDANRTQYTAKQGALYRATDTGAVYLGDGTSWVEHNPAGASTLGGLGNVAQGTLANRPTANGSQGWYFTTDSNGVYYDTGSWTLIAEHPANIQAADVAWDPLLAGDNFDGQGTSTFSNLSSLDTDSFTLGSETAITGYGSGLTVSGGLLEATSGGSGAWDATSNGGATLTAQDLSTITPSDGVVYRHDGSSSITANGASTSAPGYYAWSATDSEYKTVVAY